MCNCNIVETNLFVTLCVLVGVVIIACITIMTIYVVLSYQKISRMEETLKRME